MTVVSPRRRVILNGDAMVAAVARRYVWNRFARRPFPIQLQQFVGFQFLVR